jgi:hypothetical protein
MEMISLSESQKIPTFYGTGSNQSTELQPIPQGPF